MIVYYTKYRVKQDFDTTNLLEFCFRCVDGMKNAPESFTGISWNGEESREWKDGGNTLSFEIDFENQLVAFHVALVDETGELWAQDVALNDKTHEIQLRLAREKAIVSVEYDRNFKVPYMFKKLVRDALCDTDGDLPITNEPIRINQLNCNIVRDLILGEKHYYLPVVYVSHCFASNGYDIDVTELAKDLAGSAHVLVEESAEVTFSLKEATEGKNAYNGGVDVFYEDDSFRYLRRNLFTTNQFRYKITHDIFFRSSMRNIDNKSALSSLRIHNKIKEN